MAETLKTNAPRAKYVVKYVLKDFIVESPVVTVISNLRVLAESKLNNQYTFRNR